jgi:hypothetical protein
MDAISSSEAARAGRRIAVVGSGISGASAAWALSGRHEVTLFEAEARAGGHTATVDIDYDGVPVAVDTGFIVYNELNYPDLNALFAHLGVATHESDMSFSLSLDQGRMEWAGGGFDRIFAQRSNALSPSFLMMLRDILRFNRECVADREAGHMTHATIGEYLQRRGYGAAFRDNYLLPMAAAIWSTPRIRILDFPAASFVTFFENHRLIDTSRPKWRTVTGGSRTYLARLLAPLIGRIRLGSPVTRIERDRNGVTLWAGGEPQKFDHVMLACHSDQALAMLGDPSAAEANILGAIHYRPNRVVLHRDARLMPRRKNVWSAWNYLRCSRKGADAEICVTYWMNRLQGIDPALPLFVSLNPAIEPRPELTFGEWSFSHPQFDTAAISAQARLDDIQDVRHTSFAGAWTGYGFHEDGLRSGLDAAVRFGAEVPWRKSTPAPVALPVAAE